VTAACWLLVAAAALLFVAAGFGASFAPICTLTLVFAVILVAHRASQGRRGARLLAWALSVVLVGQAILLLLAGLRWWLSVLVVAHVLALVAASALLARPPAQVFFAPRPPRIDPRLLN
jgi:hypothetical protein